VATTSCRRPVSLSVPRRQLDEHGAVGQTRSPSFLTLVFLRHIHTAPGWKAVVPVASLIYSAYSTNMSGSMLNLHSAAVRAAEKCDMVSYPTDAFTSMMLTWNQSGK